MTFLKDFSLSLLVLSIFNLCFASQNAISDEDLQTSPPKYPSPWLSPTEEWANAYRKATEFVKQLTVLEKVNLTTAVGYGVSIVHCLNR